ncbi:hypothetical protein DPMN_074550 [Dreissena polymorpha]|uniref:C2H2-type domain-containing protein n=1 Tax=Dreissena polymorpha TaxID=45954 RepID=A0A9D3YF88_DREPO|nr:hypothetical protein DPMN_074550 [Dreissena polymorpha]
MTKIKTTPRTRTLCPLCKEDVPVSKSFQDQITVCVSKKILCKVCSVTFKKVVYLKRHYARTGHDKVSQGSDKGCSESVSACASAVNDKEDHGESDWDSDPEVSVEEKGSSSDEDIDLELGR